MTNTGNQLRSFTLGHIAAGTAVTFNLTSNFPNDVVPLISAPASVTFSPDTFTLVPGDKKKITLKFTPPQLDAKTFPVYSGWVTVTSSDGEILKVAYMGLAASLKDMPILDSSPDYFGEVVPAVLDLGGDVQVRWFPKLAGFIH